MADEKNGTDTLSDDELDQIMREMEQSAPAEPVTKAKAEPEAKAKPVQSVKEVAEVVEEHDASPNNSGDGAVSLGDESSDQPAFSPESVKVPKRVAKLKSVETENMSNNDSNSEQALTMELKGTMNLKISFTNGDKKIDVMCTEDFLICRMADGTEFKIPTGTFQNRKAA